jgi:DNA repair protein RadC
VKPRTAVRQLDSSPRTSPRTIPNRADGPRERLQRLGASALSDAELVALVLRSGGAGAEVEALARRLLSGFGGLASLVGEVGVLQRAPGVGPAKSASLVAAREIGRRLSTRRLEPGMRIHGPSDVHRHFFERLRACPTERFLALLLDGRHRVLSEVEISRGTLTASLVHPREVFRSAIQRSAAAVVLVHNHPSGDPAPSREDEQVTERLTRAGELIGIRVVDHVIVAERGFHSFTDALSSGEKGR